MTALLVGSLSDERKAKVRELHEAYVGVVEVLSKYLQSANPRIDDDPVISAHREGVEPGRGAGRAARERDAVIAVGRQQGHRADAQRHVTAVGIDENVATVRPADHEV